MLYDKLIKLNMIFVIKRFTDRNAVSEIECKDTHFFHNDKKNEYLFYFLYPLFVLAKGANQLIILVASTNGDSQTVMTELHTGTVPDNNALLHQIVINALSITNLGQEEVGICRIYLLTDRQLTESLKHA